MRKIKFLLATIMMLVGVTATHAEDITSNIRIDVSTFCTDDNGTVTSYLKDEYTVKEGVVVTFRCLKSWDETVTIYLNGTAVATWPGDAGGSKYVWTAKKDAKINWKGYDQYSANIYLTETSTVDVTGITLDPATADMTVGGETLTLTPTVLPDNATDKTVTWTTSDASVATVADGVVTAVAAGTATITATATNGTAATSDDFSATCEVTVAAPAASTGPEVAWDKATKTGTFTMPGGNVTLEPEYYPQATVADGGVTAADADARATTDDPLVKVDATKLTGAKKLMYFVSNSGTTAPAYDAEGWTDQLPTAEGFTQQGIVYVWYYPVGIDEGVDGATATYSDGDICLQSITARIADAPTYAVEFADDTAEPTLWKAEPATGVKKGQTVKVTYTGTKKVIGVKVEKKVATPSLSLTNPTVGQVIGSDGKNYAAANVPSGVDKVAMIAYVSGSNGLAIALADESSLNWTTAKSTCEAKTPAFTGGTWKLPTQDEWKNMFKAFGGNNAKYTGLNNALAAAGGNGSELQTGDSYWSSSEIDENKAYLLYLLSSDGDTDWYDDSDKNIPYRVRACLAF